jgi:hypothetical protein
MFRISKFDEKIYSLYTYHCKHLVTQHLELKLYLHLCKRLDPDPDPRVMNADPK